MKQMHRQPTIYILGEPSMVSEFGASCEERGVHVLVGGSAKSSPKQFKRSSQIPTSVVAAFELTNTDPETKHNNLRFLDKGLGRSKPILTSSVTLSAAEQMTWVQAPERLMGIGAFPTLLDRKLVELAPTIRTSSEVLSGTTAFFAGIGREISIVQDRVGYVMPRILCMLINEACFALAENLASAQDIDTAMKLGTNYPEGPIAWGEKIGFRQVLAVLEALLRDYGEDRYRVAPLLRQLAFTREAGRA